MKTLTISVADEIYQRASQRAAAAETSLPEVVQDFLCEWSRGDLLLAQSAVDNRRRADFVGFLDELASRPLQPGPSVGPLNREELHERGVPGY